MPIKILLLVVCLALGGLRAAAGADSLTIAAASDLVYCLTDLNQSFRASQSATEVKVSTGSSGNFFAQIQNGAPFDIFLSADLRYPQEIIKAGKAEEASLYIYAQGRLVLWTTKESVTPLDPDLKILADSGKVARLAIANPGHAPYGRAAKAALTSLDLWPAVQNRLVVGDNIAQTAEFVQTQNADAGLVALALVVSPKLKGVGHYVEVSQKSYPPLLQAAVITSTGTKNTIARKYLEFLRTPQAREIFDRFGFLAPAAKPASP
jgi:molybdate transport system substrate-binding protein